MPFEIAPPVQSFHPKAWRFEPASFGIAFVGSSNLSRSALDMGIEWNLRADRDKDSIACAQVPDAFEDIWGIARRLDADWIDEYAAGTGRAQLAPPTGDVAFEALSTPPTPHAVQLEALERLREIRSHSHR